MPENFSIRFKGQGKLETGLFKTLHGDFNKQVIRNEDNQKAVDEAIKIGYEHGDIVDYEIIIHPKKTE